MSFIEDFPHTSIYDKDLGWLIRQYKELNDNYEVLKEIYDIVKKNIADITIKQLEEWLSNGTLEQLINSSLFHSKIGWYSTVEKMTQDTTLAEDNVCYTLGYYTANDGGGGLYKIVKKTTQENIGNYVFINSDLVAVLIEDKGKINLNQYGIKQYNEDEPLNIFDNTPILQYAIEKSKDNNGGIIQIGTGKYAFKGTVTIRPSVKIVGCGNDTTDTRNGTEMLFMPQTNSDFIVVSDNDKLYGYIFNVSINDLSIYGNEFANTLIKLDCVARSEINNVTTKYGKTGVYINYGMSNHFNNMRILYPIMYGLFVDNIKTPTTNQVMNGCYIGNSASRADARPIYLTRKSCFDFTFNNCVFETMPKPSVIMAQNKVIFNNLYNENIPTTSPLPTFEIGILRSEKGISNGHIDNTVPPVKNVAKGNVKFIGGFIQGSNTQNVTNISNLNLINIQCVDFVSFDGCTLSRFNKLYNIIEPSHISNKINYTDCIFDNVSNISLNRYFKPSQYNNCLDINSLRFYNDITQIVTARQEMYANLSQKGWFVFGEINNTTDAGGSYLIMVSTTYVNSPSQNFIIAVSTNTTTGSVAKLSSNLNTPIDMIRIVKQPGINGVYLELHYNLNIGNEIRLIGVPNNNTEKMKIYSTGFYDNESSPTVIDTLTL